MGREALDVVREGVDAEGAPAPRGLRAHSLGTQPLTQREREEVRAIEAHPVVKRLRMLRPLTRGDCKGGQRPCPWASCSMHLAFDVNERTGSIKENFPGRELADLAETCALDVADRGPTYLETIGELMGGMTLERIRQLETDALEAARRFAIRRGWAERVAAKRLKRIRRAATRRRRLRVEEGGRVPWGTVRVPGDRPPCFRCGREVGGVFFGGRFVHTPHRTPAGKRCHGTPAIAAPAD